MEFADGESLFVCNVCDEGVKSEAEKEKKKITRKTCKPPEDLNSWDDEDLYGGFDEEGHRITPNDNLQNQQWSHWTVPPWRLVEGGTVCFNKLTYQNIYIDKHVHTLTHD